MDIESYNCNNHNGNMKMDSKHHEHGEIQGPETIEVGGRLEYWTPGGKSLCSSIVGYSDDNVVDNLLHLPKVDNGCNVRRCWRDYTGASRTSSLGAKPFARQQARATTEEKEYHNHVIQVDEDIEEVDAIANGRHRYGI